MPMCTWHSMVQPQNHFSKWITYEHSDFIIVPLSSKTPLTLLTDGTACSLQESGLLPDTLKPKGLRKKPSHFPDICHIDT